MKDENKTKSQLLNEVKKLREDLRRSTESSSSRPIPEIASGIDTEIYSHILDTSPDAVVILQDGVYKYASRAFTQVFGYTQKDIKNGLSFMKLVQAKDVASVHKKYNDRLKGAKLKRTYQIDLVGKTGKITPTETSARLIQYLGNPADLVILRDISERKTTENALKKIEATADILLNATNDMAVLIGPDGEIVALNKAMNDRIAPREGIIGKSIYNYVPPGVASDRKKVMQTVIKTKKPFDHEEVIQNVIYKTRVFPIFDNNGDVENIAIFTRDITDRRQAELELQEYHSKLKNEIKARKKAEAKHKDTADRLQVLVNTPRVGIVIAEVDNLKFNYANPAICKMLGYSKKELLSKSVMDIHPADKIEHVISEFKLQAAGKKHLASDIPCLRKNGKIIYCDISTTSAIIDNVKCNLGYFIDISDKIEAERALKASEIRYRKLIDTSPDGITLMDVDGTILMANKRAAEIAGLEREERMIGLNGFKLILPPDEKRARAEFAKALAENRIIDTEFSMVQPSGKTIRLSIRGIGISDIVGGPVQVLGIIRDITERYNMESALKESEKRYRITIDSLNDGLHMVDRELIIRLANPFFKKLSRKLKFDPNIVGKYIFDAFPFLSKRVIKEYLQVFRDKKSMVTSETSQVDDTIIHTETRKIPVFDGSEITHIITLIRNITEEKEAEKALKDSEKNYRELFNNILDGVYRTKPNGEIIDANPALAEMLGYGSVIELLSSAQAQDLYMNPKNRRILTRTLKETGELRDAEFELKRKDGRLITILENARAIYDGHGKLSHYEGVLRDITEIKKDKEKLRQTLEQLEATMRALPDIMFEVDRHGTIFNYHAPDKRLLYLEPEEFIGKAMPDILPPEVSEIIMKSIRRAVRNGSDIGACYSLDLSDGQAWFELSVASKGNPRKADGRLIVMVRNITDRIHSEEAYRAAVENSMQGLVIFQDDKALLCNRALAKITGLSKKQLLAKETKEFFEMVVPEHREEMLKKHHQRLKGRKETADYALRLVRKNKEEYWAELNVSSIEYSGQPAIQVAILDINERKQAEEALRESEEHFRQLAKQSPNMVFINQGGKVIYANERCSEILGYDPDLFYSDKFDFMKLIDREYREVIRQNFMKHSQGYEVPPAEYVLLTKEGIRIEALITTRLIRIKGDPAILGIVTEIGELKKVQEELRKSEENFKALAENANDGFLVAVDEDSHVFVNKAASIITGYSNEELLEVGIRELTSPDELEHIQSNFKKRHAGDEIQRQYETNIRRKDGTDIPIEITAAKTYWRHKPAILAVIRDITYRKKTEEELKMTSEELHMEREALKNKNIALNEVLSQIDKEKDAIEAKIAAQIDNAVIPLIKRLKTQIDPKLKKHIDFIEREIRELTSAEVDRINQVYSKLTPREIEICMMVKNGFLSKEIAEHLNVSILTIHKHRELIRKKLGLQNQNINLNSYLQTLSLRRNNT